MQVFHSRRNRRVAQVAHHEGDAQAEDEVLNQALPHIGLTSNDEGADGARTQPLLRVGLLGALGRHGAGEHVLAHRQLEPPDGLQQRFLVWDSDPIASVMRKHRPGDEGRKKDDDGGDQDRQPQRDETDLFHAHLPDCEEPAYSHSKARNWRRPRRSTCNATD